MRHCIFSEGNFQSPQNKRGKRPHENAHHLLFHHFLLCFRDDFLFFGNVRMTMFIGHEKNNPLTLFQI